MKATTTQLDEIESVLNDLDGQRHYTLGQLAELCPDQDVLDCFDTFDSIPAKNVLGVLAIQLGANLWEVESEDAGSPQFDEIRRLLFRRIAWLRKEPAQ
jgi:hypothetical protein